MTRTNFFTWLADHNEWPNRILYCYFYIIILFLYYSPLSSNSSLRYQLYRNYWEAVNLLFRSVWDWENIAILGQKILDVRVAYNSSAKRLKRERERERKEEKKEKQSQIGNDGKRRGNRVIANVNQRLRDAEESATTSRMRLNRRRGCVLFI